MFTTTTRHLMLLHLIPRAPRSITAKHLAQALADRGIRVAVRSVQRDLDALSALFPLISDPSEREFRWSFSQDANVSLLPPPDLPAIKPPILETTAPVNMQVTLLCDRPEFEYLRETQLGPDQRLIREASKALEFCVSMPDTEETRGWLMANAQHCEVLAPVALRADIRSRLQTAVQRWAGIKSDRGGAQNHDQKVH